MSFLEDVEEWLLPAVGGTLGFLVGGPVGAAAGVGLGASISGTMAQADALEEAGHIAEADSLRNQAIEQQKLDMARQLFDLGTPGREAIAGFAPQIANQLGGFGNLQNVGTGPVFQAQLEAGLAGLNRSLAPSGTIDSSISDRLRSNLTSDLLQSDLQSRLQVASNLLGQSTGTSGSTNLFGQTGGTNQGALAQAQIAGISPQAGFFNDLSQFGSTLASPALLQQFGLFQGAGGTIGAGNTGVLSGQGNIATGGF